MSGAWDIVFERNKGNGPSLESNCPYISWGFHKINNIIKHSTPSRLLGSHPSPCKGKSRRWGHTPKQSTKPTVEKLRHHYDRLLTKRKLAGGHWQEMDLVFPSTVGTPINQSNMNKSFKKLLELIGLPSIRFHDLRHTAASLMLNYGIPVIIVSRRLGHARQSITLDIYGYLIPGKQEEVAELMDSLLTPIEIQLSKQIALGCTRNEILLFEQEEILRI